MTNLVILVRNRYALTEQCIVSLYAHTNDIDFNLVVVDDGSTDTRVIRLLRDCSEQPNCSVLTVANSGHVLSQLKNLGVAWSKSRFGAGDYLLLADNDCYFLPGWLEYMTAVLKDSYFLGVLGGQRHPFHGINASHGEGSLGWSETDAVAGTSQLMDWSTWEEFGPLTGDAAGTYQSEDHAFCQRVRTRLKVGYVASACIVDCGITQTDGTPSVGHDSKSIIAGVHYA